MATTPLLTDRTIIDVLRRGNQELFHSSMIAWLLDATREHGQGSYMLRALGDRLAAKGHPRLAQALASTGAPDVRTEVRAGKSRYDIVVTLDGHHFVFENKTKTIGGTLQLNDYQSAGNEVIALGLCDASFKRDVYAQHPHLTYADVLEAMQQAPAVPADAFGVLFAQYQKYLERELPVFEAIVRRFGGGGVAGHGAIVKTPAASEENDRRFLNMYLLEQFARHLDASGRYTALRWDVAKDMISGVWMALRSPELDTFAPQLVNLRDRSHGHLWYHLELHKGIFAESWDEVAGEVQLRCRSEVSNKDFHAQFRALFPCQPGERYSGAIKARAQTTCLIRRDITKAELMFDRLAEVVSGFQARFA